MRDDLKIIGMVTIVIILTQGMSIVLPILLLFLIVRKIL